MAFRKLRMGMIGGGKDAFIGAVHRLALNMDGQIELVAGTLSVNPEIAVESGRLLFLDEDRIYTDYRIMLEKEAAMPADKRLDFITIVTPNYVHFDPALMALENGFNVLIENSLPTNSFILLLWSSKIRISFRCFSSTPSNLFLKDCALIS